MCDHEILLRRAKDVCHSDNEGGRKNGCSVLKSSYNDVNMRCLMVVCARLYIVNKRFVVWCKLAMLMVMNNTEIFAFRLKSTASGGKMFKGFNFHSHGLNAAGLTVENSGLAFAGDNRESLTFVNAIHSR